MPAERRRADRDAKPFAHECVALLDIIGDQAAPVRPRPPAVDDDAKTRLADIIAGLNHLASR